MSFDRPTAVTIIAGSLLFLAAAFSPISRVFGMRDAALKLEVITAAPAQWAVAQVLFALGAVVTAAGVAMLASRLAGSGPAAYLSASAAALGAGALLWCWHLYLRGVDPAAFTAGQVPVWSFAAYSLLTMIGLALLGLALLETDLPRWVGRLALGSAGLFLVLGLVFGDMPPFVYYLVTLAIGVVLYRAASASVAVPA